MTKRTDVVLVAVRALIGGIFLVHGVPKLLAPESFPLPVAVVLALGVVEVLGASALILGVGTRAATIPLVCVIVGALALVQLRLTGDLLLGVHPELERDLLVLIGLLGILSVGPGRYSLESKYRRLRIVPKLAAAAPLDLGRTSGSGQNS